MHTTKAAPPVPSVARNGRPVQSRSDDLELAVRDDGVGMPETISMGETGSLGLRLVKALSEQLEGKLELTRQVGTQFTLRSSAAHERQV